MAFQVVGYDDAGEPVYKNVEGGSVMGSVMGQYGMVPYGGGYGVYGGESEEEVVGRAIAKHRARHGHPAHHRAIVPPAKPEWRSGDLAHGVQQPDEGLLPMPLSGAGGTNVFTATVPNITFESQVQKPYRAERMVFIVTRTGASAAALRAQGQIFVGTDLQQGELGLLDFESLGAPTAFGFRLSLTPASPGVFLRLQTQLVGGALTGTDTIAINCYFLGRVIH
jgi:hypothetical protein